MPEIFPLASGFAASLLTPASLFVLLNLVIGTILIASRFTSNRKPEEEEQHRRRAPLVRAPSLIDRVKSINLSFSKYSPFESDTTSYYTHDGYTTGAEHPPALERPPSFLQRLKSVNFSSLHRSEPELAGEFEPVLERTPSFLQRLKSMNFSSLYRSEPEPELAGESELEVTGWDGKSDEVSEEVHHHHVKRSKSEQRVAPEKKEAEKMKKSASEKGVSVELDEEKEERERVERRRPQTASFGKTTSFGDEGVDAKADDFINRFKQQLKLQRLDSLLRYRDMLKGK